VAIRILKVPKVGAVVERGPLGECLLKRGAAPETEGLVAERSRNKPRKGKGRAPDLTKCGSVMKRGLSLKQKGKKRGVQDR